MKTKGYGINDVMGVTFENGSYCCGEVALDGLESGSIRLSFDQQRKDQ